MAREDGLRRRQGHRRHARHRPCRRGAEGGPLRLLLLAERRREIDRGAGRARLSADDPAQLPLCLVRNFKDRLH